MNAKQHREREILDYHISSIEGDTEEIVRYKKKIIKGIKKKREQNRTFVYLTKHMGKGMKLRLKLLKVHSNNGNTEKILYERNEIERALLHYNYKHFSKAKMSDTFKDKINRKMYDDSVRDKILNGIVDQEDVDSKDLAEFLKLLKCGNNRRVTYEPITEEE